MINLFDNSSAPYIETSYAQYSYAWIDYSEKTDNGIELRKKPLAVTVLKIGDNYIVDPDTEEEKISDVRLTVASTEDGTLCALQKGGDYPLTSDDISKMVDIGLEKAKELRGLL